MRFTLLGPVGIVAGDRRARVPRAQARGVLGVLLLDAGRVVSTAALEEALWGGAAPASARAQVQSAVSAIRRQLGKLDADDVLLSGPAWYRLAVEPDQVDAWCLERSLGTASQAHAAGRHAEAARLLREGLALWQGEPLADAAGAFVEPARARLAERRLQALGELAACDLALGRHAEVAAELTALVDANPLNERLRARLMVALYRCGRQVDALATYRAHRELLADSAGLDPGGELAELELAILRRDPRLDAPGPESVASAAPPATRPVTPGIRPAQLPADPAEFVGRADELAELDALLPGAPDQRPTAVLISAIAGTAGIGKTAFAVHWAHRASHHFPDGQLHVRLAGPASGAPTSPARALAQLLRSLGVAADQVPGDVEEAAALYRSLLTGKRMLVLVDNAHSAEQVRPLLPGAAGCMVLVTSRDRLAGLVATHGAHRLTLDALTPAEAIALLSRLIGAERAAAEPEAVAELAHACAYLPLALRIAAANLTCHPGTPVEGYVARLRAGDRLAGLEVDGDRQAAVRAAFDDCYGSLGAPARRLFRLLGLVPGPTVTVPAAAALAAIDPDEARRLLDQLAATHLLQPGGPDRLGFHDLLRDYAEDRGRQEDSDEQRQAAVRRLLGWYLHTAGAAAALLNPGVVRLPRSEVDAGAPAVELEDPAGALAWLDAEWVNLVAAIAHATEHSPYDLAWLLADTLRSVFWMRRHVIDWLPVARASLAAAERVGNPHAQAAAHLSLGDGYHCLGRCREAIEHLDTAIELARTVGWIEAEATVRVNVGIVHADNGRLQQAIEHYRAGLDLFRRLGQQRGQATALVNLGFAHYQLGAFGEAEHLHEQALAVFRQIGSRGGQAYALEGLGEVAHAGGRLDQAREHLASALTLHREVGNRSGEVYTLGSLAEAWASAGHPRQALDLAEAALTTALDLDDRPIQATTHNSAAAIHLRLGHDRAAVEHYEQALTLARETGSRYATTSALLGLAVTSQYTGQHAQASNHAREALALATDAGYRLLEARAAAILGDGPHRLQAASSTVAE